MLRSDDPVRDAEMYQAELDEAAEEYPVCDWCGETIFDEYFYDFDGECVCEECMNEKRMSVEAYIEREREKVFL